MIILNSSGTIAVKWEPGMLEWLSAKYPRSGYREVELTNEALERVVNLIGF